jgi:hypothetical protein
VGACVYPPYCQKNLAHYIVELYSLKFNLELALFKLLELDIMILSIPNQALGMYRRVIPRGMVGFRFAQSENKSMTLYDCMDWRISIGDLDFSGRPSWGGLGIILGKSERACRRQIKAEHTGRRSGKGGGEVVYIVITR